MTSASKIYISSFQCNFGVIPFVIILLTWQPSCFSLSNMKLYIRNAWLTYFFFIFHCFESFIWCIAFNKSANLDLFLLGGHLEFKPLFDTFRIIFRLVTIQNRIQHTRKPLYTKFHNLYIKATCPSLFLDFFLDYI